MDIADCGFSSKTDLRLKELRYLMDHGLADIALCVRDIRECCPGSGYETLFFDLLGLEPDYKKIDYFILLDEMF